MPLKRPAHSRGSSSDSDDGSRKQFRSSSPIAGYAPRTLKVYIVQAKIEDESLLELYDLIESTQTAPDPKDREHNLQLELVSYFADADIIITSIRMKKRLERHVEWDIAVRLSDIHISIFC